MRIARHGRPGMSDPSSARPGDDWYDLTPVTPDITPSSSRRIDLARAALAAGRLPAVATVGPIRAAVAAARKRLSALG